FSPCFLLPLKQQVTQEDQRRRKKRFFRLSVSSNFSGYFLLSWGSPKVASLLLSCVGSFLFSLNSFLSPRVDKLLYSLLPSPLVEPTASCCCNTQREEEGEAFLYFALLSLFFSCWGREEDVFLSLLFPRKSPRKKEKAGMNDG
ncbi:hypothetical protein CSUI_007863, partial [Cystoisospora suis]